MARRTSKSKYHIEPAVHRVSLRRSLGRNITAFVSSAAVAAMQVLPAYADVVAVGGTGTTVSSPNGTVNVTTTNVQGNTSFNQFSEFNVGVADTVNLFQTDPSGNIVNIITGGSSLIEGAINARIGIPTASISGGNLYFVNSAGFVVAGTSVINAGQLTLSTPTTDFVNNLIDEADGNFTVGTPTQVLFAGGEPLSATGNIDIQTGAQIFATRLDMRAGRRMILDGRITVEDPTSTGPVNPAVNLQGEPTAGGVQIGAGGVIRLVSGGTAEIRGEMSASGGTAAGPVDTRHGGLVEVIAEGDLTVGGSIDVSSDNAIADIAGVPNPLADGGAVMMLTKGSATMEAGLAIDATSVAGSGGFFALRAVGDINSGHGELNTGPGGEAFLIGDNVNITGNVVTRGGGLGIRGVETVNVRAGAGLSTRQTPVGTDAFTGAASANAAGDLIISSEAISVEAGATLRADGAGADNGGMLALIARNTVEGIAWAINPDAEVATITIDQASVIGGSVVISAIAEVENTFGALNDTVEAQQVLEMENSTTEAQFDDMLDNILLAAEDAMGRGLTTLNGLIPVQVQVLSAEARVTITDSTITADGNWDGLTAILDNQDPEYAANGYLAPNGLRENTYQFFAPEAETTVSTPLGDIPINSPFANDNPYLMNVKLPTEFDTDNDSLLIHSHAQNNLTISPFAYGLGLAVASTQTTSIVDVTGTALTTNIGNTRLASTAMENHTINIAAKKIANGAGSVVVSVRDLTNQLLVDGGSINSAGGVTAGAWTGRNLSLSSVANSGQEGRLAIAVNVDVSTSLTEAAVGGTINAGDDVAVDAESLYFNVAHVTTATMGLANVAKVIASNRNSNSSLTAFAQNLRSQSSGKDPNADPTKPHFGLGVAVDIQLSDDNTFATLGGNYHDLADPNRALTALGATNVTALGHNVAVNAAYRFADRGNEGGGGLSRSTSAAFGKLTLALQRMVDRHNNNPANANNQITKDDLLGTFSNALMLNVSIASMLGETQAEVGGNLTINAGALDVNALTRYPNTNPVQSLVNQWDVYVDQVTNYSPISTPGGTSVEPVAPPAPDLAGFIDIVNPLTYLTTESKTKAETPGDVTPGEEQELALGISLTLFNTENTTTAVIRDGANVTLDTVANVLASQEAVFLHVTNLPKSNPLGGDAKVNDSVGAGLHVGRTVSTVRAEVESGAEVTVNSGDLNVSATTGNIAASLAYSGGQGTQVAVNASIAAQISEADTVARIGEAAVVTAQGVNVTARDNSVSWSTAGAITGSENVGVGASGVFNFSRRNIWAGIGPADRTATLADAPDPQAAVIDAATLTILAENNSLDVTAGVAGTKVVGKADPPPNQDPPANTEDDDMIIPSWLFSDEENDAVNAQSDVDTPADQSGQQQKSGWAVSGAAVVNISLGNETSAEILTNRRIDLAGALSLNANNNATAVNVGGAVSAGLGSAKDTNALAGAFAVHVDNRVVRSRIVGAEITAGEVLVEAKDLAAVVNIAVGGAGTSRGDLALAGSVAWAQLGGETIAEILNSDVTSTALTVRADDQSTTVGVGGAVGVNMDATQGYGVGVGIAVNNVNRSAMARVSGTGSVDTGAFLTRANTNQQIYGFGTSVGVGKTGLSGSISVNTITGGAKAHVVGTDVDTLEVKADSITVDADENNLIFSLGGALAGGRSTAVGGALTVNVVSATTEARLDDVIATKRDAGPDLGIVNIDSDSTSRITSIAVAGAAAVDGNAAGVGISGNEITANTITSLEGSSVTDAASIAATADSTRIIHSLGGGVGLSGKGAAGVAATVNLLLANNTKVILDGATLTTRAAGTIRAAATAGGEIKSLAAGISASQNTSIGGAVTVNVTTAETQVTATGATITADGALTLSANDTADIDSLSGGAALSLGGTGVGGAVSANFIGHNTRVLANGGSLTGNGVTLQSVNSSSIDSMAVGLAGGSSNAFSGSIAIGDIGNVTQAQAVGTVLNAGTGVATIDAGRTGDINILSGSAAVGGSNAVGIALTVATIHGGVAADLITDQTVTGSALNVTARNTGNIDALAVSGSVGAGGAGGAGSVVYTQIGKPAPDGPSVAPLPGPAAEDPLGDAQAAVAAERDQAVADLGSTLSGNGSSTSIDSADMALALNTDDVVRARVELTGTDPNMPEMNITATETTTTRSLAGAVGVGVSSAGVGAGIAVNMMFGRAEAELVLPDAQTTTVAGAVNVGVTQTGTVETAGVAGGGGGSVGAAGSITVNVMNRQAMARIIGATAAGSAVLATGGNDVNITAIQTGTISSLAGAVGIGGNAGVGGAIVVNVISDDARATAENVQIDASDPADAAARPLQNAGEATVAATQTLTLEALAASVAGSGTGAFAGSFAVNVADGNVTATAKNAALSARTVTVNADATPTLTANAGAISASGVAVGVGISTNVARQTVRADVDGTAIRGDNAVRVTAKSTGSMSGNAISGGGGGVAVTGSGIGNTAENTVEALIRDTAANDVGSDVLTRGSVFVAAEGTNTISLLGGTDENPGLNVNFSGGGTAGVGASVTVNALKNDVRAAIEGNTRVVGLGLSGVTAPQGTRYGVVMDARGSSTINMVSANGAVGGIAGVAALFNINLIEDKARVQIGAPGSGALVRINPGDGDLADEIGTDVAGTLQDVILNAQTNNTVQAIAANIAVGGQAGVGAGSGNTLVENLAEVAVTDATINARRDIDMDASATTDLDTVTLGLAGGFVGVSANASVNRIGSQALIGLDGARLDAGRNLLADTQVTSDHFGLTGAVGGGAVGASGGVQVTLFDSTSAIRVGKTVGGGDSVVEAGSDLLMNANTTLTNDSAAVSGAGGLGALALAANITLIEAETSVDIGTGERLTAGNDLTLQAADTATIVGKAGSAGAGAAGIGASLDYANFAGTTQVVVGDNSVLNADAGGTPAVNGGNMTLSALSTRNVDSGVAAIAVGSVGVSGAVSIVEMGAIAEDEDNKRGDFLADAQTELASDQNGDGLDNSATAEDRQNTGGSLVAFAGGADTQNRIVTSRKAIDLVGAPSDDVVKVEIGSSARLNTRGDMTLNAAAMTGVTQIAGGGAASITGGVTSGIAVANVGTGAAISVGDNSRLTADGDLNLQAGSNPLAGRNEVIYSQAATLAGSAGLSVGVGVSVATLSSSANITLGDNVDLAGSVASRAAQIGLTAQRTGIAKTNVYNLTGGLAGGVGVAVSNSINTGLSSIQIGSLPAAADTRILGNTVTLIADDKTRAVAEGEGSSGGILAGVNSVIINAENRGGGLLNVVNTQIQGTTVTTDNRSAASAAADAKGIAAGAVGIGASVAESNMKVNLTTNIAANITATNINMRTRIYRDTYDHSTADASSTSGGILAGNGAEAEAYADYALSANYAGTFNATNRVLIETNTAPVVADAYATGKSGGAVAVGVTIARAGQSDGAVSSVTASVNGATITAGTAEIKTANAPSATAEAISGSGGIVSGSGAENRVTTNTSTTTNLGNTGALTVNADTIRISTDQNATLASKVDTLSAAAVGVSGADSRTNVTSAVATRVGSGSRFTADNFDISANTSISRPQDDWNIQSGSGGAIDVSAMVSRVDVTANTDLFIDGGANLTQTGLAGNNQFFNLGTFTNIALADRLKLDAGGAIAVPVGDSAVTVNTNRAHVTLGAANIFSVDTLTIYSGGSTNLLSEVDSKSYGLAGAASALTEARYNADNRVILGNGSRIESLGDVRLQTGYNAQQAQNVVINAEARTFNKTAFPINIDPVADAIANTISMVDVQEGANVLAVRDVYLLAEEGRREVLGYGRGKDLYREVAAALGTAISEAFGGEPVSLDIETGTSTNLSNDGILVNGYVRAGSRNRQILILDPNNQLNNGSITDPNTGEAYTNAMAEGIEYNIRENVSLGSEIQARIDLLQSLIDDPIIGDPNNTGNNSAAVTAWRAERDQLAARALTLTGSADFIDLEDIIAAQGDIIIRADYVHGTATGTLDAPGNATIKIHVWSDAFLNTAGMIIPEDAGGRITFNDVIVHTPQDIAALAGPFNTGPIGYEMISGTGAGEPLIEVATYGGGSLIVGGDIFNADGIARFAANGVTADLDVRADISAKTIELTAGRDFVQGFTWGFTEIEGDPGEIYEKYFEGIEAKTRAVILSGYTQSGYDGDALSVLSYNYGTIPEFTIAPRKGRIRAGRNVYITADKLNINGLIQAGTGSYDVNIDAGLDAYIASLVAGGTSGTILLHDPSEPVNENVVRNHHITSDVRVTYDPLATDEFGNVTGQIILDPMIVQGGVVELVGEVFSTGGGEIRSLDGFGNINVNSASALPVVLNRVDLGALGELGQGVEGVVRITDTSRTVTARNTADNSTSTEFLITEFRRVGGTFEQRDNSSYSLLEIDLDGDGTTDISRVAPENLVHSSTANGGRTGTFATRANRDLVINRSETVTRVTSNTQTETYFWVKLGESKDSTLGPISSTPLSSDVAPGLNGVYLADSLAGTDYEYHFTGQRISNRVTTSNHKTDDKRFLGIGDVVRTWDSTQTATHLYTHRLKADYGVNIVFDGADTGGLTILNQGDVILTGAVNNQVGNSLIRSALGSVLTTDSTVLLSVGNLTVDALGGRVGGYSTAFRVDQSAGATLTSTARDRIDIRETSGDMNVNTIRTTDRSATTGTSINGQVTLQAEGSILASSPTSLITGSEIDLRAYNGGIGSGAQALRTNVDGVSLTARARGDINIAETAGDLPVDTVLSETGSVRLAASDGSILDRNNIEKRDIRTESELAALWTDELNLNGAGLSGREDDQVDALIAERERSYEDYWQKRNAAGGAAQTFTLDPAVAQSLLDSGWDQAQLDAYVAERNALYVTWNGEASYDSNFTYVPTVDERAALLDGIGWTTEELDQWVRAGLIRGTGDTNVRIEDPNISAAGDITLIARDEVGELLPDYVLGSSNDLAEDLRVLSQAERADVTIDNVNNIVTVRRAEDVNFAFTQVDANMHSLGNLRVSSAGGEIFLGAETAATIAQVTGTSDVQIKIDGAMTDDRDGTAAIRGSAIIVESGNTSPIGTSVNPLTFDILPGGSLIARSGVDVNVHAIGDMQLQEVFAGGRAQISAVGAILDDAATGAVRVRAADLAIDGGSVGTDAAPLVIEITDTTNGSLDLTTRTGGAFVTVQSDLPISKVSLAGGGRITATGAASLLSADTISFGTAATLALILPQGIDLSASSGTDIAGGTLVITSGGAVGDAAKRLETALASLSFTAIGTKNTPLFVKEADGLRIETIVQTHADADTDIIAGGPVSIGTVTSNAEFILLAQAITDGSITAARTDLTANGTAPGSSIGGTNRMVIETARLFGQTTNGDIILQLNGAHTDIESLTAGGTGLIDLRSGATPLTLLAGTGIRTNGGSITANMLSMQANADILSLGGNVDIDTTGNFAQAAGTRLDAGTGLADLYIGNDMNVSQVVTQNTGRDALNVFVRDRLSVAPGQTAPQFVANEAGSLATFDIGRLLPVGPEGLTVQLSEVDMHVHASPLHLQELDGIILNNVRNDGGLIDVFANGETVVHTLNAGGGAPVTVSTSTGNLLSDGATLTGGDVRLFAFGGAIAGESSDTFMGDSTAGVTTHFYADGDLRYTETAGDLRVGFALSDKGDLELSAPTGSMTLGVLGAAGDLTLTAADELRINIIGRATVDLADEVAMQLVEPSYYGLREARSPNRAELTATGTGSTLYAGLVNVKSNLGLHADNIDVHSYDATPSDDLMMQIDDSTGDFAENVDVQSIGDGPVLLMTDFFEDVRPRLGGRDFSDGNLILTRARIGTGQVTHAGPGMLGQDIIINGDVWFRQRSFDLFSHINYVELSTVADAQVYAINRGAMSFSISDEIILITENVLVLNRRLGGVDLNGGQGFAFGVGVETDILGFPFTFKGAEPGVTGPEVLRQLIEQHNDSDRIHLPQFITDDQGDELCAVKFSREPCLEVSMLQ